MLMALHPSWSGSSAEVPFRDTALSVRRRTSVMYVLSVGATFAGVAHDIARRMRCEVVALAGATLLGAIAAPAVGAQQRAPIVIAGQVVDSGGRAIPGADVSLLSRGNRTPVRTVRTDSTGVFLIRAVAPAGPYELVVRRLGFAPDTIHDVARNSADSVSVAVTLRIRPASLPTVRVTGRHSARFFRPFIDSTEIATSTVPRAYRRTALDVVERLRPVMKGETWKGCPATQDVFVNGRRMTSRSVMSPQHVLADIAAEDIAEMRYVNCWDTSLPGVAGNNAIYVVLKPGRSYPN